MVITQHKMREAVPFFFCEIEYSEDACNQCDVFKLERGRVNKTNVYFDIIKDEVSDMKK